MKPLDPRAILGAAALLLLSASESNAHTHDAHRRAHVHHRHVHSHGSQTDAHHLVQRNAQGKALCSLPNHPDLVRVPGLLNNGFAMSPDQECVEGIWCPIACKAGKVMAQWEPGSSFTYPSSMNGGLYCGAGGKVEKPFRNKPFCVDGAGTVSAVNECGKPLSFCQTILPGNEAMLSPTVVYESATLAVPDPSYWRETSAHFYINPPGVEDEGCIWGDPSKPVGNWATYVAGANQDANGRTFVTLGYNPIWEGSSLSSTKPNFAVKIECPGGGCNGTPCYIDPSENAVGDVTSDLGSTGAGGSQFCVVTVPKGGKANIVVYPIDASGGDTGGDDGNKDDEDEDQRDDDEEEEEAEAEEEAEEAEEEAEEGGEDEEQGEDEDEEEDDDVVVVSMDKPSSELPIQSPTSTAEPSSETSVAFTPANTSAPSRAGEGTTTSTTEYPSVLPGIFHGDDIPAAQVSGTSVSASLETSRATSESVSEAQNAASVDSGQNEGMRHENTAVVGLIVALIATGFLF
ncbi:hypothetical protein SODALDRAFT_339772 [Sodiomyces alkalinus F11]|uniref:SUN-domain-containing protein n=1 Tax=Sodiomyces alkalinus (strain CBS 110278 / VKM F-3762 / F11) TaxID=1314773 RepID=A0A3N2PYF5_SODAK|nr:hypothetical protein SODALDRAFT_339772 [Sodiomyces alkalinus F11]ROT39446.1 hypothetical protein SODALDRAFT_339772 [Sodiomyces alkalinus F11]